MFFVVSPNGDPKGCFAQPACVLLYWSWYDLFAGEKGKPTGKLESLFGGSPKQSSFFGVHCSLAGVSRVKVCQVSD